MESSLKVDFQNQITEIGNHAFDSSLITGITGTNKLVKIGEYAFNSCAGISGKVELPAVTEMPMHFRRSLQQILKFRRILH